MKNLKLLINKNELLLYFVFFFCFEPKLFVKYNFLNYLFILGVVISFFIVLLKEHINGKKFSKMFMIVVLYRLSFAIQTFVSMGDITMWGYFSVVVMTLCLAFDYFLPQIGGLRFITVLTDILLYLAIVNLVLIYLYPNGIIDGIYYIGIRTRATDVLFPLIAFSLIRDYIKGSKLSGKSVIAIVTSLLTIIKLWIATAIIGLCVISIILVLQNTKFIRKVLDIRMLLYFSLLLNFLVVYGNITELFGWFIQGFLHKSVTLSSRTMIWEGAKKIINKSPLFGYGMSENGNFVWFGFSSSEMGYWQAHNMWLQLLHDGGLITTLIFCKLITASQCRMAKYKETFTFGIVTSTMLTFFIMMITEIYSYTPYFFLLIFLCYYIDYFVSTDDRRRVLYE